MHGKLYAMDLDSQMYVTVPLSNNHKPIYIDYDPHKNKIYWTDVGSKQIRITGMDGKVKEIELKLEESKQYLYIFIMFIALSHPIQFL